MKHHWLAMIQGFILATLLSLAAPGLAATSEVAAELNPQPATLSGQTATLLPSGQWLLLGGQTPGGGVETQAELLDPRSGTLTLLASGLHTARYGHIAALLPDGTVLIGGGLTASGTIATPAERFDPVKQSFSLLPLTLLARAWHSATVLADGQVLLAGGVNAQGQVLASAELYNPQTQQATLLPATLTTARAQQVASLLPDGTVLLWGGIDSHQQALASGELYDPASQSFSAVSLAEATLRVAGLSSAPAMVGSTPAAEATGVALGQPVVVRFSTRLDVTTLDSSDITVLGPNGVLADSVVAVDNGLLLFITPTKELLPASRYTVFIKDVKAANGQALPFTVFGFTTLSIPAEPNKVTVPASTSGVDQPDTVTAAAHTVATASVADPEDWIPTESNFHGDWRSHRASSSLQSLPPLSSAAGVTALAGQVLILNGKALANVTLSIGTQSVKTDASGRFLLSGVPAGTQTLTIDATTANTSSSQYGYYQDVVTLKNQQTTALPYTIWMTRLDASGNRSIPSPTTTETIITTPRIPGLELHLPAGTVIRGRDGKIVTQLNITAIPVDRAPFPLPNVGVPTYFTIQPGGALIQNVSGSALQGARLYYPNFSKAAPGSNISFWNYDPRGKGWYIYGEGTVSPNGAQVIPNPGVAIYELTGAMTSLASNAPASGPPCNGNCGGDPVDLYTGLFVNQSVDLAIADTIPIQIERVYRQSDPASRSFGIGTNLGYDMFLSGDSWPYTYQDLILPDGSRVHYVRTSSGTGFLDAAYVTNSSRGAYFGSILQWDTRFISSANPDGCWSITLLNGTIYIFPEAYLQTARKAALIGIQDRYGNALTLTRDSNANLTQVLSPNGRSINLSYDSNNRITLATDSLGRQVSYQYDTLGRLMQMTDPAGNSEYYGYDPVTNNMLTVTDKRGNLKVTNTYDINNRVAKQVYADNTSNAFAYTLDDFGNVTQTNVTDGRGIVTRYVFNSSGYAASVTEAVGLPEQRTTSNSIDPATNLLLSTTDGLNRTTAYTYDANGNVLAITRLSGTPNAVTTNYTYTSTFNELQSITDELAHTTTLNYDARGDLLSIQDANNHITQFGYNSAGLRTSITDALTHTTNLAYTGGDLTSITDPLTHTLKRTTDPVGRLIALTDPLGNVSRLYYDPLDRPTSVVDPMGKTLSSGYDANGNLTQFKDAKGNSHSYSYDPRNYRQSYTDPLKNTESYLYDPNHNVTSTTDRKKQITSTVYDPLNRPATVTFADGSTINYSYDAAYRVTGIVDSINGSIGIVYNGLDQITSVTTPKGAVSYTYLANGLRQTMTVSGQPAVTYSYDPGNRLLAIQQAAGPSNNNVAQTVSFIYDAANRRSGAQLPNGVSVAYAYDAANHLTSLTYSNAGGSVIGTLTYGYDADGHRNDVGGSLANTALPPTGSGSYNAANEMTAWGSASLQYDANGNLTNDGSSTYVWNARNQLVQIEDASGNVTASYSYDALGRRQSKTIGSNAYGYVYDGQNVAQLLSGATSTNGSASSILANYLNGLGMDERYAVENGSGATATISSYLTDALGSTLQLLGSGGAKVVGYTYDPYGNTTADSSNANPFQYTGRENDGNGWYYYRARYYSPKYGRFGSQDPLGLAAGPDVYAAVGGNPVSYTDPSGLDFDDPGNASVYPASYNTPPAPPEQSRPLNKCEMAALQPFFGNFNLSQITLTTNNSLFPLPGYNGITFGNDVFIDPTTYSDTSINDLALIAHEITHSTQYADMGGFTFAMVDLGQLESNGYSGSSIEKDAYSMQAAVQQALKRKYKNGLKCGCK